MNDFVWEKASFGSQSFMGFIQDDTIIGINNQIVGYTAKKYQEALDTASGYEEVLYENGLLERPKTPEDLAKETQDKLIETEKALAETQEQNKLILEKLDILMKGNANDGQKRSHNNGK